jgi:drug/metabolite transporter (DMT)-like permease
MSFAIAIAAAVFIGAGLVLQQHAAEQVPQSYFLRLRLFTVLLRKPRWLLGIVVAAAGQVMSVWVLARMELTIAEPLLATNLIFALALAGPLSGQRLRRTELIGAMILSAGVAALSLSRTVSSNDMRFGSFAYWPAAAGIGALAMVFVRAGFRRSGQQRATLTGTAAGLVFGISDALTRRTVQIIGAHHAFSVVFTSWSAYGLLAASLIGLWLMQSSFNAAPLHASLPAITAAEPVTGIILGVLVFGDAINISPGILALQAAGIAALVTGVIMVARAPALSRLRPSQAILAHLHGAATALTETAALSPPKALSAPSGLPGPEAAAPPAVHPEPGILPSPAPLPKSAAPGTATPS